MERIKMDEKELAIMNEAFMIGRIYATNGEKETPAEIHDKLMAKCEIISKHSSPNTEGVKEWQKCPKCDGQGIVSKPPYVAGDQKEWSDSSCSHVCNVCNGAKIIKVPTEE